MGKKILWMSWHEPHRRQIETLRNTCGGGTAMKQGLGPSMTHSRSPSDIVRDTTTTWSLWLHSR